MGLHDPTKTSASHGNRIRSPWTWRSHTSITHLHSASITRTRHSSYQKNTAVIDETQGPYDMCTDFKLLTRYKLNAQNLFIHIILHPSTCFEQLYANPQEVKLDIYSIWYRGGCAVHRLREDSSLNLCTARSPRPLLQRVTIPNAVYIQFDLLKTGILLLETCRAM